MTKKPDIPKRLASRLNAVYRDVVMAQSSIISSESNSTRDRARIEEYERDPDGFACKYYGKHPYDSYPVQTNIMRCREGLERRALRKDEEYEKLRNMQARQRVVEEEVLAELEGLRPSTPGRVPWPKPPRPLLKQKQIDERYTAWLDKKHEAEIAADEEKFEAQQAEEDRAYERQQSLRREQFDRWVALMDDEDRIAFKRRVRDSLEAVKSGQIGGWDIATEWAEIEADAERLAKKGGAGSGDMA